MNVHFWGSSVSISQDGESFELLLANRADANLTADDGLLALHVALRVEALAQRPTNTLHGTYFHLYPCSTSSSRWTEMTVE